MPASSSAVSPRQQNTTGRKGKKNRNRNSSSEQSKQPQSSQQLLSHWELTNLTLACNVRLMTAFLKHLEEKLQESILEDLFEAPAAKTSSKGAANSTASKKQPD